MKPALSDPQTSEIPFILATLKHCGGADFFSVRTLTARGIREMVLLVSLWLETGELIVSPATAHPNQKWACKQTPSCLDQTANRGETQLAAVMHGRDTKFTPNFVATLKIEALDTTPSAL